MAEPPYGHESSGIDVRRVLEVGAIIALVVIVSVSVIRLVLSKWVVPQHAQVVAGAGAIPPAPRLQPHPEGDVAALHAQKQALLSTWGWVDPRHDFAHVPIERAMALYARQHATEKGGARTAARAEESGQ